MFHPSIRILTIMGIVLAMLIGVDGIPRIDAAPLINANSPNLVVNSSVEEGDYAPAALPTAWRHDFWNSNAGTLFTWENSIAHSGSNSIKISAPQANDAFWLQDITVEPHTLYRLSGWIKTENVIQSDGSITGPGANLTVFNTWTHTAGISGNNDWTFVSILFDSGDSTSATIGGRLGYWAAETSGTAWFDDIQVSKLETTGPAPSWKILTLIYATTDFTYADSSGTVHHVIANMSEAEKQQVAENARIFAETDIPALTSGKMSPSMTIRYPTHSLTSLSVYGDGWWPAPNDVTADRDPEFDSVIVVWDPRATDQATGAYIWIGSAGGLTAPMGTGQTYATSIVEMAANPANRNVFKHEWGHSILFYYDATGAAPKPAVDNHINIDAPQYVHCPSGEEYNMDRSTLEDDSIPNTPYHNLVGFTHDYYSGSSALREQPTICLGITPAAWITGGPISKEPPSDPGTLLGTCANHDVYEKNGTYNSLGWSGTIKVGDKRNNTLNGTEGADLILGMEGNDLISGKGGADIICGGEGVDFLLGANGNDMLDGGPGNDVLNGGSGDFDELYGRDGNDALLDGDGTTVASAGAGNDDLVIVLRNGWRNADGQPIFDGMTAGYGNDKAALAILGNTAFTLNISGDEYDDPASSKEGKNDRLGLIANQHPASNIIKFENIWTPRSDAAVAPREDAGAEYLTEEVGGDGDAVYLPLIAR